MIQEQTTQVSQPSGFDDIISLSEIMGIILNGKWWIMGSTALFALGALFYLWAAVPIYSARTLIQFDSGKPVLSRLGEVVEAEKLNIVVEPDYFPVVGQAIARRYRPGPESVVQLNSPVPGLSGFAWGGERIRVSVFNVPEGMRNEVFTLVAGTDNQYKLLYDDELVLRGRVGERSASASASATIQGVELLITQLEARPGTRFNLSKLHLTNAVDKLEKRLSISEKGKNTGTMSLSITGPDREKNLKTLQAITKSYLGWHIKWFSADDQSSLEFLESKLPEFKARVELAQLRLDRYQHKPQAVGLNPENKIVLDELVGIDSQLAKLDMQIQNMSQRYSASHPDMIELAHQRKYLEERRIEFTGITEELPEPQEKVFNLVKDVELSTLVYSELLSQVQELKVAISSVANDVHILEPAHSGIEPVKPKKAVIAVLVTLLGGMLGLGLVFVRDMLRQGVKTPEELEAKIGLPVYATIPYSDQVNALERNARKSGSGHFLLARSAPKALAVESLRSLRTNLSFTLTEVPDNRIMITTPSPGVGKSFVSANLAELLAETDKKVLLISADMRKGHLHRNFGLPGEKGLADMLIDPGLDAAVPTGKNLDIICGGKCPSNPSELLISPAFTALLEKASSQYDVVLVDTPPVLAVTDAAIIGQQCGTVFMVVRAELTPVSEIDYATKRLQQAGVGVHGVVLNGLVEKSSSRYGYYQYSYE